MLYWRFFYYTSLNLINKIIYHFVPVYSLSWTDLDCSITRKIIICSENNEYKKSLLSARVRKVARWVIRYILCGFVWRWPWNCSQHYLEQVWLKAPCIIGFHRQSQSAVSYYWKLSSLIHFIKTNRFPKFLQRELLVELFLEVHSTLFIFVNILALANMCYDCS